MDLTQAREDILAWITSFVERPHPALSGWPPCPFARRARLQGELDIRAGIVDPYTDLQRVNMEHWGVIAYVYDPRTISADRFEQQIHQVNLGFLLPRDIIALADHPDSPEEVLGVCMNQGQWALAFVQPLSKLNSHANQLAQGGYYDHWPEGYLQALFQHRQDPRG